MRGAMYKPFTNSYHTEKQASPFSLRRKFPNLFFLPNLLAILLKANMLAKKGKYNEAEWVGTSINTIRLFEKLGVVFSIENLNVLEDLQQPCIFVGNHMSTLDAFILPSIIQPLVDFTFVGKSSLLKAPLLKHIIMSRNPIIINRVNPREDFKYILAEGAKRLRKGISVVVFPQATRTEKFDAKQFNSLGVKLAKHTNTPIVPVALCTNAWRTGKFVKDMGRIVPSRTGVAAD